MAFTSLSKAVRGMLLAVLGLAPAALAQDASPLKLDLKAAIGLALERDGAAQVELAVELAEQARLQEVRARSALLPQVEATVSQTRRVTNLEALGLTPSSLFRPPRKVGPFSTFDARAGVTQTLFDFSSIRNYQAARAGARAAQTESLTARDRVAAETARLYLDVLRTQARLESVRGDLELARALLGLAERQKEAGTGTAIEVDRAGVEVSNQEQRLLAAEFSHRQAGLRLLQLIGADLRVELEPAQRLELVPVDAGSLEEEVAQALEQRADLRALERRQQEASLRRSAARLERVPSLVGFADYGTLGESAGSSFPTYTLGLALRIPLFSGGDLGARRAEAASQLRRLQIQTRDLRRRIELEVRLALGGLVVTSRRVATARGEVELARQEVTRARRRYRSGVTTSLEVVDAQARLERARGNHVQALFEYNLARVNLAEAQGTAHRLER